MWHSGWSFFGAQLEVAVVGLQPCLRLHMFNINCVCKRRGGARINVDVCQREQGRERKAKQKEVKGDTARITMCYYFGANPYTNPIMPMKKSFFGQSINNKLASS
jgi:hypothetical protein